jgi:NAD(P)-dependent dehydrogenase (short-subunit alcohol dehydrogenase family)
MKLAGKTAVVTGAARGIGRAFAEALAAEGAFVVSFDLADGTETVDSIRADGGRALHVQGDITDEAAVEHLARIAFDRSGRFDILVNNAAVLAPLSIRSMDDISLDEFDHVMKVNVRGAFQCTRAAVPYMRRTGGGKIVNISSTTAFGGPPMHHYIASKGAIISMTYALAAELGKDNICVNALAVGFTESDGVTEQPAAVIDAVRSAVMGQRHIKKTITPADMAKAMLFLVTEGSDMVTGHTLIVDGGFVMR